MAEYTTDADKAKRDRYLYVMALLVGQRGEADLGDKKVEGVLHTSTPFADLPHKIVLKGARVVDETDPRFAFEFKGKVEAVVEEGYEVHFDVIDVTDVFSVDEVRPRPVPHHTPCAPPHPPRTPPRQHVHAA